ncbi:MAG: HAD family hydrolase [Rhizobium sp.]|nr:MAG: HAD family hydrolase [Rhizobium sp.]
MVTTAAPCLHHDRQCFEDCRWVVFDAVGTLITPKPSVSVAYHTIGQRYGSRLELTEVSDRFRAAFRRSELNQFPGAPIDRFATNDAVEEARWRWIVNEVLADTDDPESCFQDLWTHFAVPTSWECYEDTETALNRLSEAGYRLAMASNFDGRLHSVCEGLPQLQPMGHRIVSAAVEYRKPAPAFYRAVTEICQCQPHQILMVGDDLEHDVLAPRQAGFCAVHLDRKGTSDGHAIASLNELTDLLLAGRST